MSNISALSGVNLTPRRISGTAFPQVGHVFAFMPVKMRLTLAKVKSMGEFTTEGDFADDLSHAIERTTVVHISQFPSWPQAGAGSSSATGVDNILIASTVLAAFNNFVKQKGATPR